MRLPTEFLQFHKLKLWTAIFGVALFAFIISIARVALPATIVARSNVWVIVVVGLLLLLSLLRPGVQVWTYVSFLYMPGNSFHAHTHDALFPKIDRPNLRFSLKSTY
jgi:hypothetical protein